MRKAIKRKALNRCASRNDTCCRDILASFSKLSRLCRYRYRRYPALNCSREQTHSVRLAVEVTMAWRLNWRHDGGSSWKHEFSKDKVDQLTPLAFAHTYWPITRVALINLFLEVQQSRRLGAILWLIILEGGKQRTVHDTTGEVVLSASSSLCRVLCAAFPRFRIIPCGLKLLARRCWTLRAAIFHGRPVYRSKWFSRFGMVLHNLGFFIYPDSIHTASTKNSHTDVIRARKCCARRDKHRWLFAHTLR